MLDDLGVRRARAAAVALLARYGYTAPEHIDLEAIARDHGVELVIGGVERARARLQYGAKPVVRISRDLTHPGARRFSIAHELGHVVLRHPPHDHAHAAPSRGPAARQSRDIEVEANAFAAELLMPTAMVRPRCEVSPLDLAIAHGIAHDFRVTVVAAARRVVELTSERAATVYAEHGAIRWARSSPALPWELARGQRLHPATVAADYFRAGVLDERAQAIPVGAWFPEDRAGDAELVEHSLVLRDPPAVLSLLWISEAAAARLRFDESSQSMEQEVVADLIDLLRGVYR